MILKALSESLPISIGVALSPLPIAGVTIILMTERARTNAPAFWLGWVAGILSVGLIVLLIPGIATPDGAATTPAGLMSLAAGFVMIGLSIHHWRQRPRQGEAVAIPRGVAKLDGIGVIPSAMGGFLFSAVNPKNLLLTATGAASISSAAPEISAQIGALLLFAILPASSVAAPIVVAFLVGERAETTLRRWRTWLIDQHAVILAILMLVFGTIVIGGGLKTLLG